MTRTRSMLAAAVAAGCVSVLMMPGQAQAAGSVHLHKIYYDSPGPDRGSNASLNAEYVQIKNSTSRGVSLKGWTLVDASNHKYVFGTFTLGAGKIVTVRTGTGNDSADMRYQDRDWYVWNNDKDKATLKRSTGAVHDTCSYNSTAVDYKMC